MGKSQTSHSFFYRNSLSIVFITLFIVTLAAQALTGWHEHNSELAQHGAAEVGLAAYLQSGHFISATFENFESEFLQMALYVVLTIGLRQKGSAESKSLNGAEEVDRQPVPTKDAPWPVRKGGVVLAIYKHSLSLAFVLLFLVSWALHFYGSWLDENQQKLLSGQAQVSPAQYLAEANFWLKLSKTGKVNSFRWPVL